MPLLITVSAVSVAAVAYTRGKGKDTFESKIDLSSKTSVKLLPQETALTLFEAPLAGITFFEGDPDYASVYLRERVASIAQKNPWLGGWLRRDDKSGDIKLYYDPSGDELVPGLFTSFDVGVIGLTRETPYPQFEKLMRNDPVTVKVNAEIIGFDDEPMWRVSIIPDARHPTKRFAIVVSMSHLCGDNHTFYHIHKMLDIDSEILKLNPHRKVDFKDAVMEKMGKEEAEYIVNVSSPSKWEEWIDVNSKERIFEKRLFIVSSDWLKTKKEAATDCSSSVHKLSSNDIITSWFWKTLQPAVGLMVMNFRNRLPMCTDLDAGNYHSPIPYMADDYASPELIRKSLESARRCGPSSKKKLPKFSWEDTSFSVSTNWATFSTGEMKLGGDCKASLHMPLFYASHLDCMPSKMSMLVLFYSGPEDKLAAFIMVPKSVSPLIDSSGIVGETISKFESEVVDRRVFSRCL